MPLGADMPSSEVLEFETLLAPLGDGAPCGDDLRADASPTSLYYTIKDGRSAARATERQAVLDGEDASGRADWRPVLDNGRKALSSKSKDLEVVAYMIEALVRQKGFPGLRDGFRLARELIERFWDDLYPRPDEDGLETRIAPLTGLNGDDAEGTLIGPITQVPLTQGSNVGPFAYHHYQQASALNQLNEDARQKRIDQGAVTLEQFERAITETPASFFGTLVEDITSCQEEFSRLGTVLYEKCGSQSPPTSNIQSALESCLETVRNTARDKLASLQAIEAMAEAAAEAPTDGTGAAEPGAPSGAIRSREDALLSLLKVADWFRRNEPHTPVSYALEQAVRWGRMSLPELLGELIPEEGSRKYFFERVGIRHEVPPSE